MQMEYLVFPAFYYGPLTLINGLQSVAEEAILPVLFVCLVKGQGHEVQGQGHETKFICAR